MTGKIKEAWLRPLLNSALTEEERFELIKELIKLRAQNVRNIEKIYNEVFAEIDKKLPGLEEKAKKKLASFLASLSESNLQVEAIDRTTSHMTLFDGIMQKKIVQAKAEVYSELGTDAKSLMKIYDNIVAVKFKLEQDLWKQNQNSFTPVEEFCRKLNKETIDDAFYEKMDSLQDDLKQEALKVYKEDDEVIKILENGKQSWNKNYIQQLVNQQSNILNASRKEKEDYLERVEALEAYREIIETRLSHAQIKYTDAYKKTIETLDWQLDALAESTAKVAWSLINFEQIGVDGIKSSQDLLDKIALLENVDKTTATKGISKHAIYLDTKALLKKIIYADISAEDSNARYFNLSKRFLKHKNAMAEEWVKVVTDDMDRKLFRKYDPGEPIDVGETMNKLNKKNMKNVVGTMIRFKMFNPTSHSVDEKCKSIESRVDDILNDKAGYSLRNKISFAKEFLKQYDASARAFIKLYEKNKKAMDHELSDDCITYISAQSEEYRKYAVCGEIYVKLLDQCRKDSKFEAEFSKLQDVWRLLGKDSQDIGNINTALQLEDKSAAFRNRLGKYPVISDLDRQFIKYNRYLLAD